MTKSDPGKPEKTGLTQSRKENLQSIGNPKNAILYQRNPKIDEKPQPLVS